MAITATYRCTECPFRSHDSALANKHRATGHTVEASYQIDYWFHQDGKLKRTRKTFLKAKDAEACYDLTRTKIRQKDYQPPAEMTVAEGAALLLEKEKKHLKIQSFLQRQRHVVKYIVPAFGKARMTALTWEEIEVKSAAWPVGAKTVNSIYGTLGRLYTVIGKKLGIRYNPMTQVDRMVDDQSLEAIEAAAVGALTESEDDFADVGELRAIGADEVYSTQEIPALLTASTPGLVYIRHALAVFTGARHGELAALQWEYIDLDAGLVGIRRSLTRLPGRYVLERPKTKSSYRDIPIGPKMVAALRRWKLECPPSEFDLVLCNEAGLPVGRSVNIRVLKRTAKRAKIKPLSINNLRHTYASQMLLAGKSSLEVSKLMGHSNMSTTEKVYARWCHRQKSNAAAVLERRLLK